VMQVISKPLRRRNAKINHTSTCHLSQT
jgi:hypothetical protein